MTDNMRKHNVVALLRLPVGHLVGLTAAQAQPRAHCLKPLRVDKKSGAGEYEVVAPVEFKKGEQIFAGDSLPKHLAVCVEPESTEAEK